MRRIQFGLLILALFLLAGCDDDDTTTDPVPETPNIEGLWAGERVVQSIAPVTHLLAIQLWANIDSNDPPLLFSCDVSQTGNEISLRLTDTSTGYFIEYEGTISGEDIAMTSTIVSYPPMVTRVTCADEVDRHYDIQTSVMTAIVHDGIITGTLVNTCDAFISESGLADGEIVFDHTFDLTSAERDGR